MKLPTLESRAKNPGRFRCEQLEIFAEVIGITVKEALSFNADMMEKKKLSKAKK